MGEVYLANDTRLHRPVAVKLLTARVELGARAVAGMLQEARAAAALDHPNICQVFDVGEHEERPFIVMQYVEGETLAARLRRGRLAPETALGIVRQIAQALHVAHARGIVHRDVKPQNVMITPGGQVKLLDFGLAKVMPILSPAEETQSVALPDSLRLSAAGTPAYMAPEQVRGEHVDGRTDLFALGAVLYECFTGRPAFARDTLFGTLEEVLHRDPPPPSSLVEGLDSEHDLLCSQLLEKDPAKRMGTASELLEALDKVGQPVSAWRKGRPRAIARGAKVAVTIGMVIMLGLAARHISAPDTFPFSDVPESARRWYAQGADAVREGSFTKARRALSEAIAQHDAFPLAHARLAEALSELDDSEGAKTELLKVRDLVPDPSVLDPEQRLRLAGISAMVARDFGKAVTSYTELATMQPGQADVQVDLARALERFEKRDEALQAYRRSAALNPDSAVARLRLGIMLGERGDDAEAQEQFEQARRLYEASSNTEGVVETLLARGTWLNQRNRLAEARRDLALAARLSADIGLKHQEVRTLLQLSSLTASEGSFQEAEALADRAVEQARTADMDGLVASSLIDLGNVLFVKGRRRDAERFFTQAAEIARRRGAKRTAARAALSRGSVLVSSGRPAEAVEYVQQALAFYAQGGYEHQVRLGLTLLASAYAGNGELARSRRAYEQLLDRLRAAGDEAAIALATEGLSGVLMDIGNLPEALRTLRVSLDFNQRAGNQLALPFNLTREAELLASLGRAHEAAARVNALAAALDAGQEAYVARAAAIRLTRARVALVAGDWRTAVTEGSAAAKLASADQVTIRIGGQLAIALAQAQLGNHTDAKSLALASLASAEELNNPRLMLGVRERVAQIFGVARDYSSAHGVADDALKATESIPNIESSWRLHAIAAVSASALSHHDASSHRTVAAAHLTALERDWGAEAFRAYARRRDIAALRKWAGLDGL